MEPARVAEDDRPLGCGERLDRLGRDALRQLVLWGIALAERAPGPCVRVGAASGAAGDVLERARSLVDVDEIEKRLQQLAVVVVAVPTLRSEEHTSELQSP